MSRGSYQKKNLVEMSLDVSSQKSGEALVNTYCHYITFSLRLGFLYTIRRGAAWCVPFDFMWTLVLCRNCMEL